MQYTIHQIEKKNGMNCGELAQIFVCCRELFSGSPSQSHIFLRTSPRGQNKLGKRLISPQLAPSCWPDWMWNNLVMRLYFLYPDSVILPYFGTKKAESFKDENITVVIGRNMAMQRKIHAEQPRKNVLQL